MLNNKIDYTYGTEENVTFVSAGKVRNGLKFGLNFPKYYRKHKSLKSTCCEEEFIR